MVKLNSKVVFAHPPSQTNYDVASGIGGKMRKHTIRRPSKRTARFAVGGSAVSRPPVVPTTIDQMTVPRLQRQTTNAFVPPLQDPRTSKTKYPKKLPNTFSYHNISVRPLNENDIQATDGDGNATTKRARVDNIPYVPAMDPIQQQEHIQPQKVNHLPKPRDLTEKEQRELEAKKKINPPVDGKDPIDHDGVSNSTNIVRASKGHAKRARAARRDSRPVFSNTGLPVPYYMMGGNALQNFTRTTDVGSLLQFARTFRGL